MTLGKTKEKRRGTGCITEYHGTEIKTEDKGGYWFKAENNVGHWNKAEDKRANSDKDGHWHE